MRPRPALACLVAAVLPVLSAAAPAPDAALPIAALDRCILSLHRDALGQSANPDRSGCGAAFLGWCGELPDPAGCEVAYGQAVAARLASVQAQMLAAGGKAGRLDQLGQRVRDDSGFDCRAAAEGSYCDVWEAGLALDALVDAAGRHEGGTLRLPEPADVADDPGLPLRRFDDCLSSAVGAAQQAPLPVLHPQGAVCAALLPRDCVWMAAPEACRTSVSAALTVRIGQMADDGVVTTFPKLGGSADTVALRDLALRWVRITLSPYVVEGGL